MAVGDRGCGAPGGLAAPSATVGAAEADGGAVVVKLIELQGERLADRQDHIGEQGRTVGIKEPVEGAPLAVIDEVLHLVGRDAEHSGCETTHRLLLAVERLSFDETRAQQHAKRSGVRDCTSLLGGDAPGKRFVQSHSRDEMIDDGEGPEALDQQGGANHFACVSANLSLFLAKERESQESWHASEKISSCRRASASPGSERPSTPWTTSVRALFSVAR